MILSMCFLCLSLVLQMLLHPGESLYFFIWKLSRPNSQRGYVQVLVGFISESIQLRINLTSLQQNTATYNSSEEQTRQTHCLPLNVNFLNADQGMLFHWIFCVYSLVQKKVLTDVSTHIHLFKTKGFTFFCCIKRNSVCNLETLFSLLWSHGNFFLEWAEINKMIT